MVTLSLSLLHYLAILAFPFKSIHRMLVSSSPAAAPSSSSSDDDDNGGRGDCAICLAAIAGGEETRDLRCRHAFHRLCLDRWLENRGRTCPLCRDCISIHREQAPAEDIDDGGRGGSSGELVVFYPFDDFGCDDDDDNDWWIR